MRSEPEAEGESPLLSPLADPQAVVLPRSLEAPGMAHMVIDVQERMQQYIHERFKALEAQFLLEQQRQHDRLGGELHETRQQFAALTQEYQQQQQSATTAFRQTLEELRQEVSEALHRLSQDFDRALQLSEARGRHAIDELRNEILGMLLERDKETVKHQRLSEVLITLGKQLHHTAQE